MTDLQQAILKLLKEIDGLCRENDIQYYLAAGTALGAVRHQGFLPWDDDADIYMTYENFLRFCKLQDQFPEGRVLVSVEDDYDAEYTINRYADVTTTRLFRYLCASPQPAGMIVDILVLDHVPDDPECIRDYVTNLTAYADILVNAASHAYRCPYPVDDKTNYEMVDKEGREKVLDRLKKEALKYVDTRGGVLIQRDPVVPHVWKEEVFGTPRYVPFEDTQLPVAEHIYEQLRIAFDECWMYVPETIDRVEHVKGVLLDISNNNPFDDYLSIVDEDEVRENCRKFVRATNLIAPLRKEIEWDRLDLMALKVKLYYDKNSYDTERLMSLLRERRHDELDEIFAEYRNYQCHKAFIGGINVRDWLKAQVPYYIEINDDFLYIFLRHFMHEKKLGKAAKVLEARIAHGEAGDKIRELCELVQSIRDASSLAEKGKYSEALDITDPLYEKYPENLEIMHIWFTCRYYLAESSEDREELLRIIEKLSEADRDDEVVSCVKAEILMALNRIDEAMEIFDRISTTATHGLILLHVRELMTELMQQGDEKAEDIYRQVCFKMGDVSEGNDEDLDEEEDEESEEEKELSEDGAGTGYSCSEEQKMLVKLLDEIDEICRAHGLRYVLNHKATMGAVRSGGFESNSIDLNILMPAQDCKKLIKIFEKEGRPDRYLESPHNNSDYPRFALFYGNRDTIDLRMNNLGHYRNHGIHILIEILRPLDDSGKSNKLRRALELGWEYGRNRRMYLQRREQYSRFVDRLMKILGRKAGSSILFKYELSTAGRRHSKLYLNRYYKTAFITLPAEWIDDTIRVPFEGSEFPVFAKYDEFLTEEYGRRWRTDAFPRQIELTAYRVISLELSYTELWDYAKREGIDLDRFWDRMWDFLWRNLDIKAMEAERKQAWDRLFLSGDRYRLWSHYKERKDIIRDLIDRGDMEKLEEELYPYYSCAKGHLKKELGLYFDKELFEALELLCNYHNEQSMIEEMKKLTPKPHLEPIRLKDYKGNYIDGIEESEEKNA